MLVYKFGGASVRNAASVDKLAQIVAQVNQPLVIVVSAMGKTTDALEKITDAYFYHNSPIDNALQNLQDYHLEIVRELFPAGHQVFSLVENLFDQLRKALNKNPSFNYDFEYDRIVSFGELISTTVVSNYLEYKGIANKWIDARTVVKTDSNYREGKVDWQLTGDLIRKAISFDDTKIYVTQGFIASDRNNLNITLGREGSDFTAAIFAWALDASEVAIWKDVEGIFSADPKQYPNAQKIDLLSYTEATELAFYGAKVIHPKTLKPLAKKNIPLFVKSFVNPAAEGTKIFDYQQGITPKIPIIIRKENQILISLSARDNSFVTEHCLEIIFSTFDKHKTKINLMHNSALKFSVSADYDKVRTPQLINDLQKNFDVKYNTGLTLYTLRYYNNELTGKITASSEILLHQQSRKTAFYLVK